MDDFGGGNSAVAFAPQSDSLFRFTSDAPRDDAPPTPSDSPMQQTTTSVTKYYYLGGKRITMRNASGVTYLHGDHLGSASLATNASGGVHSQARYKPFGETRWE